MSLKDKIKSIAQEAALNAVNYTSSVISSQVQQFQNQTGLMTIQSIDNSSYPPVLQVLDGSGNYQSIKYIGSDYIYPGQSVFCSNGYSQ